MNKENFLLKNKAIKNEWIKNFYYNRTSVQKLLFLYSFLNEKSFLSILSKRIENPGSCFSEETEILLIKINEKFLINVKIFEFSFGFVWIYEFTIIYYFKINFDFDEFYTHFSNIEKSENIVWKYIEFYDKTVKIFEIFKKTSFVRIYRDEILLEKSGQIKKIKEQVIDLKKKESFFFIKNYNPKRVKMILYFYKP